MQRYFSKNKDNNILILNNDDIYHITRVMRMKEADLVEVVYNNELYICHLDSNYNAVIDKREESLSKDNKYICLIVPLLKEAKMDLILQKSTELGVNEIIPVIMERSIVKLDNSKEEKRIERWTRICKEAAEQSKRLDIPVITKVHTLKELNLEGINLICSTSEKSLTIKNFLTGNKNCDRINLVIGPEGGISPNEEELLTSIGFTRVSLGSRIMRVETVPLYLLSVINYEYME